MSDFQRPGDNTPIAGLEDHLIETVFTVPRMCCLISQKGSWWIYSRSISCYSTSVGLNAPPISLSQSSTWRGPHLSIACIFSSTDVSWALVFLFFFVNYVPSDCCCCSFQRPSNINCKGRDLFTAPTIICSTNREQGTKENLAPQSPEHDVPTAMPIRRQMLPGAGLRFNSVEIGD